MLRICMKNSCHIAKSMVLPVGVKNSISFQNKIKVLNPNLLRSLSSTVKEENKEIVYYGPLTPQVKAVKVFSLTSSFAGLLAQPILIREAATIGSTSLLVAICSVVGFFTFVTPLLLHFITKKYVTEINYIPEKKTYEAITINFFLLPKRLEFKVEDVHVPEVPGMFTTLHAKGKALFIEARHFNDPTHYAKMMGYDKPMDFDLGEKTDHPNNK